MTRISFRSRYQGVNYYTVHENGGQYEIRHRTDSCGAGREELPVGYVSRLCNDPISTDVVSSLNAIIDAEYQEYVEWHKRTMPEMPIQPPPIMATALNPAN